MKTDGIRALERLLVFALLAAPVVGATPPRCGPVPVDPLPSACPTAAITVAEGEEVIPQTLLHLSGESSYAATGRAIAEWRWSVEQPVGSASAFSVSDASPAPTFRANVAGAYRFRLDVWDDAGEQSCEPAVWEVLVVPEQTLHVELLWETPGDPDPTDSGPEAGTDLDLHFIHPAAPRDPTAPDVDGDGAPDPWFDQPYDCYWFNPRPNWGSSEPEADDDPSLDRDDTDGAGPENINVPRMEADAVYGIGVHSWNDHGYGPSFATVRVYLYGSLVFEASGVELDNHDMWCVGWLDAATGAVEPCLDEAGDRHITPGYQHPMFFSGK